MKAFPIKHGDAFKMLDWEKDNKYFHNILFQAGPAYEGGKQGRRDRAGDWPL